MRLKWIIGGVASLFIAVSCSSGDSGNGKFPKDFNSRTDSEKVAYMMEAVSPDSVARYICYASLGDIPEARIDSLSIAVYYAFEHYKGDDLARFGESFDNMQDNLPLDKKMKLMKLAGLDDPMGIGLKLGLEFIEQIRDNKLSADKVAEEIAAFKKSCANDPETYSRFVKGFKAALKANGTTELPAGVYQRFVNMSETL
jgi:hypothetical protein